MNRMIRMCPWFLLTSLLKMLNTTRIQTDLDENGEELVNSQETVLQPHSHLVLPYKDTEGDVP